MIENAEQHIQDAHLAIDGAAKHDNLEKMKAALQLAQVDATLAVAEALLSIESQLRTRNL